MATGQRDDDDEKAETTGGSNRRTFMKTVGITAVAASAGVGAFAGSASAAGFTASPSGTVTVDPGTYDWDGSGLDIGSGDALVGGGSAGDVVVNLTGGTMDGSVEGELSNIVVRGANPNSKAGIDLYPGATVDGFVWPEGGQQPEDRAFYAPTGGSETVTLRNSAWAWMSNNGAYLDKPPLQVENCAAVNNNITGIRVGHRDGTPSDATTTISNSLVAVTQEVATDGSNSANARGIRIRHPGNIVIENCWFVYLDVSGAANPIEIHDGAAGSTVTIRNCHFYNDSGQALVRDKSNGGADVTIENCTVEGSGSTDVEPSYSGSGFTNESASYPLPSEVTGYAAADDIEGVGTGIGPWDGSSTPTTTTTTPDGAHALSLHASPDNPDTAEVSFTVDSSISYAAEAEASNDTITDNGDGTSTAVSSLAPDELDSYRFDGNVVDYNVPSGTDVTVSLDGTATTFGDLVGGDTTTTQTTTTETTTAEPTTTEQNTTTETTTAEPTTTAQPTTTQTTTTEPTTTEPTTTTTEPTTTEQNTTESATTTTTAQNATTTTSDAGSRGDGGDGRHGDRGHHGNEHDHHGEHRDDNRGKGKDPENDGRVRNDGKRDGKRDGCRNKVAVVGGDEPSTYAFRVSGDVRRDVDASERTADGTRWERVDGIARDGWVVGLVGSGVDAFRFDGALEELTVDGAARVAVERRD